MAEKISVPEALIYIMVMVSASDRAMSEAELGRIGHLAKSMPAFDGFDEERIIPASQDCTALLNGPEGLDITLEVIKEAIPPQLYDTAYAAAVEIAAADLEIRAEEVRMLGMLRERLGLDKLTCAAIERGAIARSRKV